MLCTWSVQERSAGWGGGGTFFSFQYKSLNGYSSVFNSSPREIRKVWEVNKAKLLSPRGRDQHGESVMYIFTLCCCDEIINNNKKRKASP